MASIAELIMSQQQPNFVGNYVQGQSQGYQLDKMRAEKEKKEAINNLLSSMTTPQSPVQQAVSQPGVNVALDHTQGVGQTPTQSTFTPEQNRLRQMYVVSGDLPGLATYEASLSETGNKYQNEFLKEERATAKQAVTKFNDLSRGMRSDYGQLVALADEAKTSRTAANLMTVSLSRLASPGIVTEAEAKGVVGAQNVWQYLLQKGTGDANTDALLRSVDPYGDSFDPSALLKAGQAIVLSKKKPLVDLYTSAANRAKRAKMPETSFNTNFGDNINYDFLTSFGGESITPTTPTTEPAPSSAPVDLSQYTIEQLNAMKQKLQQ